MPFDAAVLNKPIILHDHLALLGITPVPMETLVEHKKAQERLHKAHWLTKRWAPLALFGCQLVMFLSLFNMSTYDYVAGTMFGIIAAVLSTFLWIGVVGLFVSLFNIKVYGKPEWVPFPAYSFHDFMMPAPIREVVQEVRRNIPGTIIISELRSREVVLDPYVLIVRGGDVACLGIWIDGNIIACADRI